MAPTTEIEADISALLLTPDGKVRGDFDFVFYNQAESRDVVSATTD